MKKLLIIIVTYNGMQWIDRCFGSLRASTVQSDVFVVDNGSNDGTQDYLKRNYPEVIFHQSDENLGFGRANNIGLKFAVEKGYEYVYLLNQDAWVEHDVFERMINVFEKHPTFGLLSPLQKNSTQKIDYNLINHIPKPLINDAVCGNELSDVYEISFVMAAHWMISRKTLTKVGGFSPAFRHYGEDDNYIDRVTYFGFKIGLVPEAIAIHDRGKRVIDKEKEFFFREVVALRTINNPHLPNKTVYTYPRIYFKQAKKLFYFKALYTMVKLLKNAPFYRRCRELSKSFAFLE